MSADSLQNSPLKKQLWDNKKQNIVALTVIFLFFGYVFYCLPIGVGILDESFYYTMVKRFAEGDRILADEWKINQFFTVLLIIPYQLYVRIVGSTDGLILFMRYLYLSAEFLFSIHIYRKLQQYGIISLCFTLMLFVTSPLLTFSYYNIVVNCVALILVELYMNVTPPSWQKIVLLGVLASCAVLSQPILAVVYFLYTGQVFVLAIKKGGNRAKCLESFIKPSVQTWKFLTLGILIAFVIFILYGCVSYHFNFNALVQNWPELFQDPDYSFSVSDPHNHFAHFIYKMSQEFAFCGKINVIAGLLLVAAAFIWKRVIKLPKIRPILFAAACGVFFLCYLHMAYVLIFSPDDSYKGRLYNFPLRGFSAPIVVFGLICILLSNKPAPKSVAFWWTSFIVSCFVDVSSQICFSYAGIIVLFPMLVCGREIISEMLHERAEAREKRAGQKGACFLIDQKRVVNVLAVLLAVPVLLWGGTLTFIRTQMPRYERFDLQKDSWRPLDQTIEQGPLKGIRTTRYTKEQYEKMMSDMAVINQIGSGPLYVHMISTLPYLAVDLPIGSYSAWIDEDPNMDRLLRYWELHPDRIPAVIYVPLYESVYYFPRKEEALQDLALLKELFDYEMIDGKAGLILKVNKPLLSVKS